MKRGVSDRFIEFEGESFCGGATGIIGAECFVRIFFFFFISF